MKKSSQTENQRGRSFPWAAASAACIGLAGSLWALSEVLETDTDGDGWTDAEEIVAGTNPADETDPWDSDGDGIADYLEFADGTDPLDPNDPPQPRTPVYGGAASSASVPVFRDLIAETLEGESESANVGIVDLGNPNFNAPAGFSPGHNEETENGRKIRYRVMGSDPNGWSALVGGGVEYWQDKDGATIGVELCAGPNSRGVKQRFNMETTKDFCGGYALVWEHYGRVPKSGTIDYSYTVRITMGDPSTGAAQIVGTELTIESSRIPSGGTAKECFFFGIDETHLAAIEENGLWVSISPNAPGTLSAVVGKLRIVKICMAVDKNRDATVSFGGDDLTSEAEPYRFWINNDCDSADMSEDEVSSIDRTGSDEPDCDNEVPRSWRDLEDFTRLQLRFFGDTEGLAWIFEKLKSEELSARITTPGEAKIRIWRHLDNSGGLSYLDGTQGEVATGLQVVHVAHGTTPLLPLQTKIWNDWSPGNPEYTFYGISMTHPQLNLLFEGVDEGKSQFSLELSFGKQNYQQTSSVWLELLDVRKMFERVSATPVSIEKPDSPTWSPEPSTSFSFVTSDSMADTEIISAESSQRAHIIFVHGWNMSFEGVQSYGETTFKRLWWQNYKGTFSVFYWPTYSSDLWYTDILGPLDEAIEAYHANYNHSEFRAWEYGESLKNYIAQKTSEGFQISVAAHSMGNFVVGSALNKGAIIANYALLNAAVPAECFDGRAEIRDAFTDGISFGNSTNEQRRALAYLNSISGATATRFINFYLEEDGATGDPWEFNRNYMKPDLDYEVSAHDILPYCWDVFGGVRVLDYRHEAMSMCDKSYSRAIGREPRTILNSGAPNNQNKNLAEFQFGSVHSAQFVFSLQRQKVFKFWKTLKEDLTTVN